MLCQRTRIGTNDVYVFFFYDESGNAYAMEYEGDMYYYLRNGQNDVIGIIDDIGAVVARYTYDPWGKPLTVKDGNGVDIAANATHVANVNPFRYRGYFYDTETGFYYLQTRYYDPVTGRFINAEPNLYDGAFDFNSRIIGFNAYAYCANNPVMYADPNGEFLLTALIVGAFAGAAISGAVSAVSQYVNTGEIDWKVVGVNALFGAASGALATTGIGFAASVAANAAIGGATYVAEQAVKGEKLSFDDFLISVTAGAASGAIGGKGMDAEGLVGAWKGANKQIAREMRRANLKYAAKQTVRLVAEKTAIKQTVKIALGRFTFGVVTNGIICQAF